MSAAQYNVASRDGENGVPFPLLVLENVPCMQCLGNDIIKKKDRGGTRKIKKNEDKMKSEIIAVVEVGAVVVSHTACLVIAISSLLIKAR